MTEALRAVIDYLFRDVGLYRIEAKHDAANPASGKVMLHVGMVHEGTLRQASMRKDGTRGDLELYSILRDE